MDQAVAAGWRRELAEVVETDLRPRISHRHRRLSQVTQRPITETPTRDRTKLLLDRLEQHTHVRPTARHLHRDREHRRKPTHRPRQLNTVKHLPLTPMPLKN